METAITALSPVPPPGRPLQGWRRLWQVPAFLTGLVALVGVWGARPLWHGTGAGQLQRELTAARRALDEMPPDDRHAVELTEHVLQRADRFPPLAGEAHFLLGSAYLHLAGQTSGDAAAALLQKARYHLEQAERGQVPAGDTDRLKFRLARVWFLTGGDPQHVIDYLSPSVSKADEPAEGYQMLTQAYLRLPAPDLAAALAANEKLLALPITEDNALLAPARLQRADLLLRLQRREEARAVLANIRPTAPADVYVRARALRAGLCQEDEVWPEAQKLWEEMLQDTAHPPKEPDRILLALGLCHAKQGASAEAARAWEQAMASGADAGQAAAFRLAELSSHTGNGEQAWKAFERALRGVENPAGYKNSLLDLNEARRICEEGSEAYRTRGDFESARKLAAAYTHLAPPGKAEEMLALAIDALARQARERAGQAKSPEEAKLQEQMAHAYDVEAAAAYQAVAEANQGQPGQADWLWRSADRYLQGQDYARGLTVLKRFLDSGPVDERRAEGWYVLGTVYQALHRDEDAAEAFHQCVEIANAGPYAFRARYQLAEDAINRKDLDEAEKILKQNLELMGDSPDADAHEKCLLALAGLLYRRHDYRVASVHLQQALDRYPNNPRSTMARHVLADCYRQLAEQEKLNLRQGDRSTADAQLHSRDEYRRWLSLAGASYQKLEEDLQARQAKEPLPEAEEGILLDAELADVDCRYNLGEYEAALRLGQGMVDHYKDRAESLIALRQVLRCYWVMGQTEADPGKREEWSARAREAVEQGRKRLQELDDKAFREGTETRTRDWWEQWLNWAARQWQPSVQPEPGPAAAAAAPPAAPGAAAPAMLPPSTP